MKTFVIIVRTADPARIAEAARGAVGLTLRGDAVRLVLDDAAAAIEATASIARALATLGVLGHAVSRGDAAIAGALAGADAVEVWT